MFEGNDEQRISSCPIIDRNKACTGLPEAGDRRVGLEEFANHLDRVQVQIVVPEAAKRGP